LVGPCGGFSAQYAAMCDYFSLPFREEVAWDVDTIYFSHDSHEMNLQDFEHLDHRDLVCIVSSLEHNTWFTKIRASAGGSGGHAGQGGVGGSGGAKLSSDLCDRILQVVAKSVSLQELHVASIGARWEFAAKLAQAITANPCCALASFDVSCNFVEDKGIAQLSTAVSKMPKGLRHVNLSYCSLTSRGASMFASSLVTNRACALTLTYLNLAGNTMKEESHALCAFLAQPNVIAILDISATDTPLDIMFGALVRGCTTSLTHLNMSRNPFSASKKVKEIPAAFKQFFVGTLVLQYVNMSHCKSFPPEAVKQLLLGLACNENTTNVELNLSNNNLGANGAGVFETCFGDVRCVSRLDLSENIIEAEMAGVMQGVAKNKSLLSLNVSKNMTGVKPKHFPAVIESIVQLVQEEDSQLQKLNLSDCKLKGEMSNVINALGSNQCLQHLDVSGNGIGDSGARLLAKALQINTRLKIINMDRNGITLTGYADIAYALQSNYALRHIPFPTFDLQPFVKTHPERVDSIVHRVQELLQRNASPHRFRNTAQAFRLTQGFLLSSTQQILDRVSAQTQDSLHALKKMNPDVSAGNNTELERAEGLMTDAENSKHLLSALHEVTARRAGEVDTKLKQVSIELSNFLTSHVQHNVDAMIGCADSQCPRVMKQSDARAKTELKRAAQKRCNIPSDFLSTLITDQLGLEIHNKINELNLIIANAISDRVIDEVIESLSGMSKTLVSEVGSLKKKRSLTPDGLLKGRSSSGSMSETASMDETLSAAGSGFGIGGDGTSQKSESCSPLGTPQTSRKKSIQGKKLRPKSVVDKDSPPDLQAFAKATSSPFATTDLDTVPELPSSTALQHLGKARPKRSKRHAPSRGAVVSMQIDKSGVGVGGSGSGGKVDDEEGTLAMFYTPNSSFSPGSTPSGSPMLEEHRNVLHYSRTNQATSKESSREDLTAPERKTTPTPPSLKVASPNLGRRSPIPPPKPAGSADRHKASGLSCLASATTDEDVVAPSGGGLGVKHSPEKRALSPLLHTAISDIFSKSPSATSKHLAAAKPAVADAVSPMIGASPFAPRKASDSSSDLLTKRRSLTQPDESEVKDDSGGMTPDAVMKRHGIRHGGNPDLMAEIKEKRASMAPKAASLSLESAETSPTKNAEKNLFGHVKLR
jgi:Ran GTPase-activating protein (RanGAP) involved in mRNA processing and transport